MSTQRTTCTIGDVLELQRGYDITRSNQRDGEVPVVSSGGISSFHDESMSNGPGVVIGRKGTLGKVFYLPGPYWPHDTTLWVRDFKGSHPRFVYYFFKTLDFGFLDVGSANPTLNRNHVHPLPVSWPERGEQRAIAEVLGALDDKIAANDVLRRTAAQLATARYRASLSTEVESVTVADACTVLSRGASPRYTEDAAATLVLNQKCIRDGGVDLTPARRTEPDRVRAGTLLQAHDVLVNSTGMGTLGRVAAWDRVGVATVDSHITIARPDPGVVDPAVFGVALMEMQSEIEGLAEGSTGQTELSRHQLGALIVPLPARPRQGALGSLIRSLSKRSLAAAEESHQLAALRDALLRELMSGRLRVQDVEKTVEEVV